MPVGHAIATIELVGLADAADAEPPPPPADLPPPPIVVPDLLPIGLGTLPEPLRVEATGAWAPYQTAREHLDALLDLVAARAARPSTSPACSPASASATRQNSARSDSLSGGTRKVT